MGVSRERTGRARVSVFSKCVYFQAPGTQARPLVRRADKGLLVTFETKIGPGGGGGTQETYFTTLIISFHTRN